MRQKLSSLSFAILSLLACASCQKSDSSVTPLSSNSMAGEYAITGTTSYTIDGTVSTAPLSGTLSVYAGNDPNSYYFLERYGTTELGYLAWHTSNNFTIQEVPDYSYYNSVKYYGYQKGGGTLATNKITVDRSAATNTTTYIAPTGQVSYGTKNIAKRVLITATKIQQ